MKDPFIIEDKNILITGAASGIGKAVVKNLINYDNKIIAVDKNINGLNQLKEEICSDDLKIVKKDIKEKEDIINSVGFTLDGLVNCAGIIKLIPFRSITEKNIREITINNYESSVLLTSGLIKKRKIKSGSSIVFVSSIMSLVGTQINSLYAGSKSAIVGITRTLALEMAKEKIRVNSISPAFVETPMLDFIGQFIDIEENKKDHPLGFGTPEDVANAIVFLLSDASKWITGINLIVDGGYSAK